MQEIIKAIPLFSELDDVEIDAIAALVSTQKYPKKMLIVQEGESGDSMFIILEGSVKISSYATDGREVVLSLLEKGAFFGEMALLDAEPRSATVMTMEDTELGRIRRADFERLMLQTPQLTRKLLAEMVSRLRRTSSVLERVSTMDVPQRLYNYMRDYCLRFGSPDANGGFEVKLPTHQLVADQLSTSRETISRAISALKKEGIIVPLQGRGQVRVDMHGLDTLLQVMQ
ncbi:MAG: Crp/Fnr family transcriptional regulator [Zetaproteobacteria bacterium]|nr:MAG: Crp/Fnr family transcriptional regulator [Zetaproteobacteria bacterium]